MHKIKKLDKGEMLDYKHLTLKNFMSLLYTANNKDMIAIGASEEDEPVGFAFAVLNRYIEPELEPKWVLRSFFLTEKARGKGIGKKMWLALSEELAKADAKQLYYQAVLGEIKGVQFASFCKAMGAEKLETVAKIYHYKSEDIIKSPFVKGAVAGMFKPEEKFQILTFAEMMDCEEQIKEIEAGGWYPEFVNPMIGRKAVNNDCTVFAIERESGKVAGWVTALDVNGKKQILYRTFFTKEEFRDTQIGLHLFLEAIKRHMTIYPKRDGMASIGLENERAVRFSELFFRGTCAYASYEWVIEWKF